MRRATNEIIPQTEIVLFHQSELFRKKNLFIVINRNNSETRKSVLPAIGMIPKAEKVFCHQSEGFRNQKKYFVTNRNKSKS